MVISRFDWKEPGMTGIPGERPGFNSRQAIPSRPVLAPT